MSSPTLSPAHAISETRCASTCISTAMARPLRAPHLPADQLLSLLGLADLLAQRRDQPATTFALEPRRSRVLAANVVASLAISVGGGCTAFGIAQAGLTVALADGRHEALGWSWQELAGFALFVILTSTVGSAIGSALHNTAAAIVTYFAPSSGWQSPW
jgi:ABC-2 type transport system permease protein